MCFRFRSHGPEETRAAGAALGASVEDPGLVVALVGPLGAGKTLFVRGLAEGLGVSPRSVASPTFVVAHEYPGPRRLAHVDLYRVGSVAELEAAGFLDLLEPGRVVAIEWADRLPAALPEDRLEVKIQRSSAPPAQPDEREIEARALGAGAEAVLRRWSERLGSGGGASLREGSR